MSMRPRYSATGKIEVNEKPRTLKDLRDLSRRRIGLEPDDVDPRELAREYYRQSELSEGFDSPSYLNCTRPEGEYMKDPEIVRIATFAVKTMRNLMEKKDEAGRDNQGDTIIRPWLDALHHPESKKRWEDQDLPSHSLRS